MRLLTFYKHDLDVQKKLRQNPPGLRVLDGQNYVPKLFTSYCKLLCSLPRRHSFGSSRNLSFVGEERLCDEPKECLRGRLTSVLLFQIYYQKTSFLTTPNIEDKFRSSTECQ